MSCVSMKTSQTIEGEGLLGTAPPSSGVEEASSVVHSSYEIGGSLSRAGNSGELILSELQSICYQLTIHAIQLTTSLSRLLQRSHTLSSVAGGVDCAFIVMALMACPSSGSRRHVAQLLSARSAVVKAHIASSGVS